MPQAGAVALAITSPNEAKGSFRSLTISEVIHVRGPYELTEASMLPEHTLSSDRGFTPIAREHKSELPMHIAVYTPAGTAHMDLSDSNMVYTLVNGTNHS